jgi:MtN3 and saliva related transmembrane protein
MLDPALLGTIATCYGVCGALAALSQARQIRRRGSSCDVSARFFAMYAGGYAIWLMYGVSIGSAPLILVDAAGLICGGITLAVTLRMRGSLSQPRSWNQCV